MRPGLRERETVHDPAGEGIAGACSGVRPPEGGGGRGIRGKLVGAGLPLGEWGGEGHQCLLPLALISILNFSSDQQLSSAPPKTQHYCAQGGGGGLDPPPQRESGSGPPRRAHPRKYRFPFSEVWGLGHRPAARDVLEGGGGGGGGGSEGRGGGASSMGPPMVLVEGGPKKFSTYILLAPKAPSKIVAVSLKYWKGRRRGGWGGAPPTVYGRSNTSLLAALRGFGVCG